jgi:hypothetical protein
VWSNTGIDLIFATSIMKVAAIPEAVFACTSMSDEDYLFERAEVSVSFMHLALAMHLSAFKGR